MNIRTRLSLAFGVLLALLVSYSIITTMLIRDLGNVPQAILSENQRSVLAADSLLLATEMLDHPDEAINEQKWLNVLHRNLDKAQHAAVGKREKAIIEGIRTDISKVEAVKHGTQERNRELSELNQDIRGLLYLNLQSIDVRVANISAQADKHLIIASLVSLVLLLGCVIVAVTAPGMIIYPIRQITQTLKFRTEHPGEAIPANTDLKKAPKELRDLISAINARISKALNDGSFKGIQADMDRYRLAMIIQQLKDPVVVLDQNRCVVLVNDQALPLFGAKSESELRGAHFQSAKVGGILGPWLRKELTLSHSLNSDTQYEDIAYQVNEETSLYYRPVIAELVAAGEINRTIGVVIHLHDVTNFVNLEEGKNEYMVQLTHEMQAPLAAVEATIKALEGVIDGDTDEHRQELLENLLEETDRMHKLVENLQDASAIASNHIELEITEVNTTELIQELVSQRQEALEEKGLELNVNFGQHLPDIRVDEEKVRSAMGNVLDIVVEQAKTGGQVKLGIYSQDPSFITLQIEEFDSAPLGDDFCKKVFKQFAILPEHIGITADQQMNICVAKTYVEAQGGHMELVNPNLPGMHFKITLPLARREIVIVS